MFLQISTLNITVNNIMHLRITLQQAVFHLACLILYYTAVQKAVFKPGVSDTYGGEMKFLTTWTLYLTTLYHFSSVLATISILAFGIGNVDGDDRLTNKSVFFCGILFPSSMIVCIAFWVIFAIHPDLMVPPAIRKLISISGFYNHAVHTAPALTSLLEVVFVSHKPAQLTTNLLLWTLYCSIYLVWIFWVAYKRGVWVYPFLQVMGVLGKAAFFGGVLVMGFLFVKIVHSLCAWCNTTEVTQRKSKKEH